MPRQRIAFAPYAIRAVNAGNADTVDGQHAAAFAASSHNHAGEQITSGTVADAGGGHPPRDTEVMTIVKGNDGAGSGVDADTVDGQQAAPSPREP